MTENLVINLLDRDKVVGAQDIVEVYMVGTSSNIDVGSVLRTLAMREAITTPVHSPVVVGSKLETSVLIGHTLQEPVMVLNIVKGAHGIQQVIGSAPTLIITRHSNLGVNTHRTRNLLLLITGVLTAVVTAFCGPIGFVGLVVPHIARLTLNTSNHTRLLPATMLCGAVTALLCSLLSVVGQHGIIPINAITPIIGVPIILYIIVNRRKIQYFN